MRNLAIILGSFLLLLAADAHALPTYRAQFTASLCPESTAVNGNPIQQHSYKAKYRVGSFSEVFEASIVSQEIDTDDNTGTFVIELPTGYGLTELSIFLECSNTFGVGAESNKVTISSCDALAVSDVDDDAVSDRFEDTNCNGFFDQGDFSHAESFDSDGDGFRDIVELFAGTDPTTVASSPRPTIIKTGPFDPDGDGKANHVVWRPEFGLWLVRDFQTAGNNIAVQYGLPGDIPFTWADTGQDTNYGVVRRLPSGGYQWFFRSPGLQMDSGATETLTFGSFGDLIIPGPWEVPGRTNPAYARLYHGTWFFTILQFDGSVRIQPWGTAGDIPKVADYDGDGLYDVAIFRQSTAETWAIRSSTAQTLVVQLGQFTSDYSVRGDYTGDGIEDVVVWEPISAIFSSASSESNFDTMSPFSMQLGLYNVHVPMSYMRGEDGRDRYMVIDHALGTRAWRTDNEAEGELNYLQWGLASDHHG